MDSRVQFISLIRWPVDLSVFSLAFGYGLIRLLENFYGPTIPGVAIFSACLTLTFISTYAVQRYMPSDERLKQVKLKIVIIWINVSLAISIFMPILATVLTKTTIFWLALLLSGAAKSLLSLESRRLESSDHAIPAEVKVTKTFFFKISPDAYALTPFPTALLASGIVTGIIGSRLLGIDWLNSFLPLSAIAYVILSTIARFLAIRKQ